MAHLSRPAVWSAVRVGWLAMTRTTSRPCVIVIEDQAMVRTSERLLLEAAGYRVAEIASPADLQTLDADLAQAVAILADFDLGTEMSGVDIALEIMGRAGRRIPTMVLSGSVGRRPRALAAQHQMPFIAKPATERAVLDWLADVFAAASSGDADPSAAT